MFLLMKEQNQKSQSTVKREVEEKVQNNELELRVLLDVDERTESEAKGSKFKTEVEENPWLTNCQFFLLIIWLR